MAIDVVGTGTVVGLTPDQLTFGPQKVGTESAAQTIQLTNTGSTVLRRTSLIYIGGNDYNDFSATNHCAWSLNPGATCAISVTFNPTKTCARSALVVVTDSGGGSPQTVPLSGTGD